MMSRKTRSSDVLFKLEENVFLHKDMLDLSLTQQLPTTKYVIERFFTTKGKLCTNETNIVLSSLANELRYIWIHMNIPCLSYPRVRAKLKELCSTVNYLKKVHETKRKAKWMNKVNDLSNKLMNGFDKKFFRRCHRKHGENVWR